MVAPRQRGSPCTTAMFLPQEVPTNRCGTAIFRPRRASCPHRPFRPLQASEALLYAPRRGLGFALFLGSSAVEHSTVNRMVAGSNPARGANQINRLSKIPIAHEAHVSALCWQTHCRAVMGSVEGPPRIGPQRLQEARWCGRELRAQAAGQSRPLHGAPAPVPRRAILVDL
jgi:hypothetical protein